MNYPLPQAAERQCIANSWTESDTSPSEGYIGFCSNPILQKDLKGEMVNSAKHSLS